tara:strand:+ start:2750 stop:3097 length:348 start_codon:yes stop_codon:yes gene_type:complete
MAWFKLFKAPTSLPPKTHCECCGQKLSNPEPRERRTKWSELNVAILEAVKTLSKQGEITSGGVLNWINENTPHRTSASTLSQAITRLEQQGTLIRKKPVPYRKGVVVLEMVEGNK